MKYLYVHKRVRNDEHCPICRRYYISLHETLEDAVKEAKCDGDQLKNGEVVWVDEWVRRSNGDKYQILVPEPGTTYDLCEYALENAPSEQSKQFDIQLMLLHVKIDKLAWCPNNIKFEISFYESLDSAFEMVSDMKIDQEGSNMDESKFKKMEPLWVANENSKGSGDFYQIIAMQKDKLMYLNNFCEQLKPEIWFK